MNPTNNNVHPHYTGMWTIVTPDFSLDLTEESEVEVEEPLGNPAPPPDVDLEKLRGDRIGDTVFSGKWCIQTVMKLMQVTAVYKIFKPTATRVNLSVYK